MWLCTGISSSIKMKSGEDEKITILKGFDWKTAHNTCLPG